ncbi:MAG: PSD1 domain-containing protein [Bryobacterales bacterium]|nr:PSD1 domain-containing protein [Bryobacterales bacterium]
MTRGLLVTLVLVSSGSAQDGSGREFFETKVRPVLARQCFACHSAANKMGGLDVSSRAGLLKGGAGGAALVPGKPDESLLIQAVQHRTEKLQMPLKQAKLADGEIANLVAWVRAGAEWPESPVVAASAKSGYVITPEQKAFWAFQPVRKPVVPVVKNAAAAPTPIDRFLQARMEEKGVRAARMADKVTLLRRVTYDLTGLPPTAAEVDAFVADQSADAYGKVVARLLESPRYGERWARYWLDVARYSDDRLESEVDAPYDNAFRYRDWVIEAFNRDMPYNLFVKAQIAGDQMGDAKQYAAGLGFYALRPDTQDDRVDVTGRAFLGLTTGCAQCHNHKFDPIPTTDYYALQGVFTSTKDGQYPLAEANVVGEYKKREKAVGDKKGQIRDLLYGQAKQLAEVLAQETTLYLAAARRVLGPERISLAQAAGKLDKETLQRWVKYLADPEKDHAYLKGWLEPGFDDAAFQERVLAVLAERKQVDEENVIRRAEAKKTKKPAQVVSLKTESFFLWRDLFFNDFYGNQFKQEDDGLLYYGPNRGFYESDGTVERFLTGIWKDHLNRLREELAVLQSKLPERYPYLHVIEDAKELKTEKVRIGGRDDSLGEDVPRRFLTVLSKGWDPQPFRRGSGRLELAEAIASAENPLTARVMANRVWQHHFGFGIVRTPSDFGFMGDRPSHPELLDYLASRLVESGWSVKALHREILLSAAYQRSAERLAENAELDPDNRLFWRANVRRLDAESLRDSLLAVSGELDLTAAGKPLAVSDGKNFRRSVYGFVSRRKLDDTLALFDFPNPNATAEKRSMTITPPQQLFFLNAEFVAGRARAVALRATGATAEARIAALYKTLFGRRPTAQELALGRGYVTAEERWPLYTQALLSSNEFLFVN